MVQSRSAAGRHPRLAVTRSRCTDHRQRGATLQQKCSRWRAESSTVDLSIDTIQRGQFEGGDRHRLEDLARGGSAAAGPRSTATLRTYGLSHEAIAEDLGISAGGEVSCTSGREALRDVVRGRRRSAHAV
jgi:hypothetical protein